MRKKIIAGNWKMHKTKAETETFFRDFVEPMHFNEEKEVMLFVPYLSLETAKNYADKTPIAIGAQNMHYEENGAFTGEVSAAMLIEIEIGSVLIGHSERRAYYNETNESVNLKLKKALAEQMIPVVCVGENLSQRENDQTFEILNKQVVEAATDVSATDAMIFAYEPVWAIGTGKTATSEQAEEACAYIRERLREQAGAVADSIRVLYGGSVNSSNIRELMAMPNIDGVLVGGASLGADFADIVNYDDEIIGR